MLLVLGIVSMLLLVAVPSLIHSRITANEVAAMANCKALWNACIAYYYSHDPRELPDDLSVLGPPAANPPYIDTLLAKANNQPEKQGYKFTYTKVTSHEFTVNADPVTSGSTGARHFFLDQTGDIRVNASAPASETDPFLTQ